MARQANNPVRQAAGAAYRVRRRLATALAVVLALIFGWHAFFGQNGITAYAQKRSEDRDLKSQIQKLSVENTKLQDHVDRLQNDPDAIEMVARQRLHYTRSGEVIYALNDAAPHDEHGKQADAAPSAGH